MKPLLKKTSLDCNILKNYRPISNLPFLSKVLERIVASRLKAHISSNSLDEPLQSAYKPGHSTETALLKVTNDILCALDTKQDVFLVLLDLSAAFDTVNHTILLERLHHRLGVTGNALMWFNSYLFDRKQAVMINSARSPYYPLATGVPQGSVLGPILFNVYTSPLGDVVASHGCQYHFYADDSNLYMSFPRANYDVTLKSLESCVSDVRAWMSSNFLRLNDDKTEFVIFSRNYDPNFSDMHNLRIGDVLISPQCQAKSLGTILDSSLTMKSNISHICRSAMFHIRRIALIRKYLSRSATEQLVHSFISSRIDSCNSLLYGLPLYSINRIQHVQNVAARVVTRSRRHVHVSPLLQELHWLPVRQRIIYKILIITFKCLYGAGPKYLKELVSFYVPRRSLRSANDFKLKTGIARTKRHGDRAFCVAAPLLWNELPFNIRSCNNFNAFKRFLKTHLFELAFLNV